MVEIWTADVITPAQLRGLYNNRQLEDGVRRLSLAVLLSALQDANGRRLGGRGDNGSKRRREALAWFAADDTAALFSITNVCEALGIDPAVVRAKLSKPLRRARSPHVTRRQRLNGR